MSAARRSPSFRRADRARRPAGPSHSVQPMPAGDARKCREKCITLATATVSNGIFACGGNRSCSRNCRHLRRLVVQRAHLQLQREIFAEYLPAMISGAEQNVRSYPANHIPLPGLTCFRRFLSCLHPDDPPGSQSHPTIARDRPRSGEEWSWRGREARQAGPARPQAAVSATYAPVSRTQTTNGRIAQSPPAPTAGSIHSAGRIATLSMGTSGSSGDGVLR
jgi:hypothetical protein